MVYTPITDDKKNDWIVWLETQKELIKRAGIQNYVQSQIEQANG